MKGTHATVVEAIFANMELWIAVETKLRERVDAPEKRDNHRKTRRRRS